MNAAKDLPDPFSVVAKVLGCPKDSLSMDSAMYRDHGWDSFGHVSIVVALEETYGIRIDQNEIEKYTTMRAIQDLYELIRRKVDRNA